jgi:hypothetical protein
MDTQVTIGAIATAIALGMIAHEHGFLAYVRKQLRSRRAWKRPKQLLAPDRSCDRLEDEWRRQGLL